MNFKVGDKVKILWEKAPYISKYKHTGEVSFMESGRYIRVIVCRKPPLEKYSRVLRFLPEELVPIAKEPKNGDML